MRSSSISNTTTVSNFRPLSFIVIEFWKRYHQKLVSYHFRELRAGPKIVSYRIVFFNTIINNY
jgi:hypothetical protein